ncbi:hypothetical protein GGR53DRAFT_471157 [Hypoxylon sp. FL1150]|nr:hypothetical protein GGR53DRAFT_471157 [Hypoxylon sp. FL1150]
MPRRSPKNAGEQDASEIAQVLSIIAEKRGIAVAEINVDLDFNSLFYEYPAGRDVKGLLGCSTTIGTTLLGTNAPGSGTLTPRSGNIGATTPVVDEDSLDIKGVDFRRILKMISEESRVVTGVLTNEIHFTDSGIDSLLSHRRDLKKLLLEQTDSEIASLAARKKAVDGYVQKYTAGFPAPGSNSSARIPSDNWKVVLVMGVSGSLGSNLVYHIAGLPDVKQITEALEPKLLVLQTDSSKPIFGLSKTEYEGLVDSVTRLIHNAWTMSAERVLEGFESQLQVMHDLIDLACDVCQKSVNIDPVLPNGYGDAKWGCERMLDETLHKSDRFRIMAMRLGQINALPDLEGGLYWTTVNNIAGALSDLVLSDRTPYPIYHIENPVGQPWHEMTAILAVALNIPSKNVIPLDERMNG